MQTARREANLHAALADTGSPVTVATASAELTRALGASPAGPVWLTAAGRTRLTLADLDISSRPETDRAAGAPTARTARVPDQPNPW